MEGQKRLEELDILKGMGIMLIVLGHLEPGTYIMRFIYSFHLFLFFACSGFVGKRYENRKATSVLFQNLKRLLLPYLVWSILSQSVDLAFGIIDINQAIKNILFVDANVGWNAALWFLVSLFWADTLCSVIVKMKRALQLCACMVMAGLWIVLIVEDLVVPFGLYTVPVAALFWMIGYWINSYSVIERIRGLRISSKIGVGGGTAWNMYLLWNGV